MSYRYTGFWVKIPLLVLLCVSAAGAAEPWWNPKWAYRRDVTLSDVKPTGLRGGVDIVTVEIATGGVCKPDGSDIRVTTARGTEVDSRVLMTGPGDLARVAFAKRGLLKKYYVYLGNPDAPPPRNTLEIKRGVLIETRVCRASPPAKLKDAISVFEKATPVMGARFLDRIFIGYNPFGPNEAIASRVTGYFSAPTTGTYTFSCSSNDASFMLLDDKLLISNGGKHYPQRDIRKNAKVQLRAGLHKLTFYHVNASRSPVLVAAWRKPGDKKVLVIPPGAFSLVHTAQSGLMQQRTKPLDIDFTPKYAGEAFAENRYSQRYSFSANAVGGGGKGLKWTWDFGDGQTSNAAAVDHVYLVDGLYTVTLTAKAPRDKILVRTNRIRVSRPWGRVTHKKIDSDKDHAAVVAGYNFKTLKDNAVAPAFELLKRNDRTQDMIRACTAFLNREKLPAIGVEAMAPTVAELMLKNAQPENAVKVLLVAAGRCDTPETSARMAIQAAGITLDLLGDDKEAMKLYTRASVRYSKKLTRRTTRSLQIGLGDVWRARGDYDKAAAAYKTAGFGPEAGGRKHPIMRGDFARHVESYTQTIRDYEWAQEYLDRWRRTFPADKLDGYLSLLTARMWMAQGNYARVTVEADIIARVNPRSNYGAQLLMLAVEAYRKMDQPAKATLTLKRIIDTFPESPLAVQAVDILKKK
ncbi:MAG: PKD domain-containing protein [Phycisphaerales bacterium]|jgi:tetratricopeptide (TPR) repeat protein|nr:PKD domain-containing protein [Phycisphaerales bacterium]